MNEAQLPNNVLWYCDVCEEEMNFSGSWRHINSKTQILKGKYGIVVKEYDIFEP